MVYGSRICRGRVGYEVDKTLFTSAARRIIQRAMLKTQIIITTKTTRLCGTLRVCAI
jgi:hypothetical protein